MRRFSTNVWATTSLDGTGKLYTVDTYSGRDSTFPPFAVAEPRLMALDGAQESFDCSEAEFKKNNRWNANYTGTMVASPAPTSR